MKWINKLTDEEIKEINALFMGKDEKLVNIDIDRGDFSISIYTVTNVPEWEDDRPEGMVEIEDSYEIYDFNIKVHTHSGNVTPRFRKYMYEKFGDEYAKDYLLNN